MKTIASVAIITIGLIVLGYFAMNTVNNMVKVNGVQDCLTASKVQTTIDQEAQTQTFSQPDGAWYETCMKDKGYRQSNKK